MAPLVRIAAQLGAILAAHVALQLVDRRCLRAPHDIEPNGLMRVAAQAADLKVEIASIRCVVQRRRGLRRPLKANMRSVQSSQASLSASRRASAARSAAIRTEVP